MNGNPFQVDRRAFLFVTLKELSTTSQLIYDHFMKFWLQMHVGATKVKNGGNLFPTLLEVEEKDVTTNLQLNNGKHSIQFMNKFKYLGSLIMPCLIKMQK